MILLIDNYDSFTYNLYQYIGVFCREIEVFRNDKITIDEIQKMKPERIILSPGPKSPKEAGICIEVVRQFYDKIPILGICLGHQCIGEAFGGTVTYAKELFHGKQSLVSHEKTGLFYGISSPVKVARYHSLAVQWEGLPECLRVTAETVEGETHGKGEIPCGYPSMCKEMHGKGEIPCGDPSMCGKTHGKGEIMAIQHKTYPVFGLQFHPESIYTQHGKRMIENFVNLDTLPTEAFENGTGGGR